MHRLSHRAAKAPRFFVLFPVALAALMVTLVATATLWPPAAEYLNALVIDSDPENMLVYDEPVRVFHRQEKTNFSIYDLIVVGVVNKTDSDGVFNPRTLRDVHDLTKFAQGIQWVGDDGRPEGVIASELIAPSTVDSIEQAGLGTVTFDWLMHGPPETRAEALAVKERALDQPLLDGSLISDDGQALALYIPISSKGISYRVAQMLREQIATYDGTDEYLISGLPVAQDAFAAEMFQQMATTTPLAMLLIFGLLWYFFRNLTLIASPMIIAMLSVMITMGLLVMTGNDIHIMSSMIPIFIMPIAVLDAIHILSEFYDRYPEFKDRKATIEHVMSDLSMPMLYTTLTTAVGFASLNLTPIPPIQVFGTFVSVGVLVAWFLTMTLIPAYIILMPEGKFVNFGLARGSDDSEAVGGSRLARLLSALGTGTLGTARPILAAVLAVFVVALWGISQLVPNDNPVKWFEEAHEIRAADTELNQRFAGTYMAYLTLKAPDSPATLAAYAETLGEKLAGEDQLQTRSLAPAVAPLVAKSSTRAELHDGLTTEAEERMAAEPDAEDEWYEALDRLAELGSENELFKDPGVLRYVADFQRFLAEQGLVGKSNSIVEIVKTVHRELYAGDEEHYRIPETANAVAQTLITFQSSHRPQDLWHYVTPDYREANLWLQLKSGDNQDMSRVERAVDGYFRDHPPPASIEHSWFGLTHINVEWQHQMAVGMAKALGGSFVIVFLMMVVLFRSVSWGLLAMVPLTFSVSVLYGVVGLLGIDYDTPIAILSALTLGLSVDYAIHFLSRSRELRKRHDSWQETVGSVFGEPARAIARNVVVVGAGFLPLLGSSLIPYQTVGVILSTTLVFAGFATLVILPALINVMRLKLFRVRAS